MATISSETHESMPLSASPAGRRLALIVGVNGPPIAKRDALKYAEQDALDLAQVLQDCGYELFHSPLVGKHATTEQVRKTVLALAKALADDDLVVFSFSGHGVLKTLSGGIEDMYLVTDDFDESDLALDPYAHLSLRWLREILYTHKKDANILLVLECCYAGNGGQMGPDPYLENLRRQLKFYFEDSPPAGEVPARALRTLLAANIPDTVAFEREGHGLMAGVMLPALRGEYLNAFDVNHPDCVSYTSLLSYLEKHMQPEQQPRSYGASGQMILAHYPGQVARLRHEEQQVEREQRLRATLLDYQAFLLDRVSSFVGRTRELDEVRAEISRLQQTGGYLTITGPAGQGKSSMIARLVEDASKEEGLERVAYHFIPLNPGRDHQFGLLRNLMARLILKYNLDDFYIDGQTTPALRDYFPKVLQQIADMGRHEVIYIDGLDQLEEEGGGADLKGKRDLSFLPPEVPAGIVLVLGTRPNDALAPIQLKKPHITYQLHNLSRDDFDAILSHRGVILASHLADQFYQKLGENALFLDLAAKELAARNLTTPTEVEAIISSVAENPNNLFGTALERLSQRELLWERVMKPLLGILLVAREPLAPIHLKQIINLHHQTPIDRYQLDEGLERLGGLVIRDGQKRYTLFHLKLREYLHHQGTESDMQKEFYSSIGVFDTEDVQHFHTWLVQWCEQGELKNIWRDSPDLAEQGRREYARSHAITHLYAAHLWFRLFEVLDTNAYGQAKIHWEPGIRLFAQDVELGRQAASWEGYSLDEGIAMLPRLWRYTLLRCSLGNRADNYPEEALRLLVMLGREQEAIGLAELLVDAGKKCAFLCAIAVQLHEQAAPPAIWHGLLRRAEEVAQSIENHDEQARALSMIGLVLARVGQWQQAEVVIARIDGTEQARAWREFGLALAQVGQWQQAEVVIARIDGTEQAGALIALGVALNQAGEQSRAVQVWQRTEQVIATFEDVDARGDTLYMLGVALAEASQWQQAEAVIAQIYGWRLHEALRVLVRTLAQAGLWQQAEAVIVRIESYELDGALRELAQALAQAKLWQQAEKVISRINKNRWWQQAGALSALGHSLAHAGRQSQAEQVRQQVEQILSPITSYPTQHQEAWILKEFGLALALSGQWQLAVHVITRTSDWDELTEVLSTVWQALIQTGQWQQAEQVIAHIDNPKIPAYMIHDAQAVALRDLGSALAQAGQWQQARAIISQIKKNDWQAKALCTLGLVLAQAGEQNQAALVCQQAEATIARIEDSKPPVGVMRVLESALIQAKQWQQVELLITHMESNEQTRAWRELGLVLTRAGEQSQAAQIWQQAEQAITYIASDEQVNARRELGLALAQAGEQIQATQVWQQAEQAIAHMGSEEQVKAWRELGLVLSQAGEQSQATRVWQQAEQAIARLDTSKERDGARSDLGLALAQAEHWQQAEQVIARIEFYKKRDPALEGLGLAFARAKHWQQAEAIIAQVEDIFRKDKAWSALGQALALAGQWQQAEAIIARLRWNQDEVLCVLGLALAQAGYVQQAETIIAQIGSHWQQNKAKAEALSALVLALAQMGRWQQAETITTLIEDGLWRDKVFITLGQALAQAGQWQQAEQVAQIEKGNHQAEVLIALGQTLSQAGEQNWATRVWQQAEQRASASSSFRELGLVLAQAGKQHWAARVWQQAEQIIVQKEDGYWRDEDLSKLALTIAQFGQWQQAIAIIALLSGSTQDETLREMGQTLVQVGRYDDLLHLLQDVWLAAKTRDRALQCFGLATHFIQRHPELGIELYEDFTWVDAFVQESV